MKGPATYHVVQGTNKHQGALDVVVSKPGLLIQLGVREYDGGVDDGRQGREPSENEAADSKRTPSQALELWVEHDER